MTSLESLLPKSLVHSQDAANTGAATSAWTDIREFDGEVLVVQNVGAITGTITGGLEDADDGSGTNSAPLVPDDGNQFNAVSTPDNIQKEVFEANKARRWVRYVGTIVTGPAQVSVTMWGHPKNV
jgi:hypothetical protein